MALAGLGDSANGVVRQAFARGPDVDGVLAQRGRAAAPPAWAPAIVGMPASSNHTHANHRHGKAETRRERGICIRRDADMGTQQAGTRREVDSKRERQEPGQSTAAAVWRGSALALAHRFEQGHAGRDRHVEAFDLARHRDTDQAIANARGSAGAGHRPRRPGPARHCRADPARTAKPRHRRPGRRSTRPASAGRAGSAQGWSPLPPGCGRPRRPRFYARWR